MAGEINFTPIPSGQAADASALNAPLRQLDASIGRNHYTATSDPTATDDSTAGYAVGSKWLNTLSGRLWICTRATPGTAVWQLHVLADAPQWVTKTISAGSITLAGETFVVLAAEGGAASDTLTHIYGGSAGDLLYLRSGDAITFQHNAGSPGDLLLGDGYSYTPDAWWDVLTLLCTGDRWLEVSARGLLEHLHVEVNTMVAYGSYAGNSGTKTISGLGFQPDFVMVVDDGGGYEGGYAVRSGNTMNWDAGQAIGSGGKTTSFNADGFVVSDLRLNRSGSTYFYIAVRG